MNHLLIFSTGKNTNGTVLTHLLQVGNGVLAEVFLVEGLEIRAVTLQISNC